MNNKVTIMSIPCGFKIRKKTDTDVFIDKCMCKDNEYYLKINNDLAIFIRKGKDGSVSVAEKRWDLYDPFNPLLEVANNKNAAYRETVNDYVWKYRKYINAKWFNKED